MRRAFVQVFAAIVAAGIIGTALTVLLWDDDSDLALGTPTPSATSRAPATTGPALTLPPSASPTASAPSPTGTAGPTSGPTSGPSTGSTPPPSQPASSVNCDRTPSFCTNTTGTMEIRNDKLVTSGSQSHSIDYSSVPNTTMTWQITREGVVLQEVTKSVGGHMRKRLAFLLLALVALLAAACGRETPETSGGDEQADLSETSIPACVTNQGTIAPAAADGGALELLTPGKLVVGSD